MLAKRQQCYSCKHNVYSSEKVEANGRIFHQGCLKCEECGVALTPKGLKKLNGTYYCKEHHQKNLFAPRPQKQANDEDDKDDKKQAMVGAAASGAKKKKVSIELPTSDDSSTQSSSSTKERSISFSDVVEASSGITVSGTFLTVSGLSGKKDKKAAKKQSKEAEKQKKKEEKEQAGYMRKRSSSFSGVTSGIINLVSSGGGVFRTRSRDAHSFEQDKIVEMAESSGSVEVDDNNDDSDEADEKKLALQKKIEEMKKRNEQWMKRIENEIGRKKSAKNEESESEASDSDIDTSDITFTTEQDATEISDGESDDTELMSETSDNESDDEAEVQRLLREREEELKRKREEIKRKEEEMQRKLEEMKRKEEEVLRKEEELKKKEEERMRRKKEKQQQRKKEKLAAALNKPDEDEELKQIEEEMRKQEEELRKVEEKIRLKEAKLKEKERRMLLEASGSAEVVGLVAGPAENKADATADDDAKKQKREMWMKEIDEEVERRRKDKKASQGGDAEEKVVAKTQPTKRTSGEPSRRKRELLALLNSDSDEAQEDGESTKEASPASDDSQSEEGAGKEMRNELVARCTYVWALDKQKKEEEEKKKREEDAKDAAQRERDGEQQRREALKKKEEARERKQKEEEWERMQQRVEEELRLEEAKKRVEEERRLREQTLKRRNEAWFRKMEEEMAAREETLRQLREAEEKQKAAENDQRRAMGLPPLVESSDSNTSSNSLKYDDSDKSVDIVVAAAALGTSPKRVLSKPMIPRKPLPPTPLMERERKAGSDLAGELASRRAKGISWDSMAGDMVKVSVAAGPIVHERRSSVDSGSAAAKKASSGTRRVSDVDAALDAADRKAVKASKRQSVEGVLGKASKKPLLLLRPAVALRSGPKDKKAKKQKKDMEKIMKKRKKLQKKGANALVNEERPQCLYGDSCKSLDPDHWVVFQHTPVEKREEEMKSKAEKEARRRAKGKERVSTDEDEDEAERERQREEERERRLAAERRGEESSDSVRALEEEMLKNGDTQDEEAWKVMRKQLARERERKMELAEIEREKTALLTERKRIEFEMSSIRAERKQIEEESRSRIDVRSREKQQEREANNRGRVGKGVAAAQPKTRQAHVQERNNFYMQKLQNIKDKKPQQQPVTPQKKSAGVKSPQQKARASAAKNGVARVQPAAGARKPGSKKLPAVPRSSSSSASSSPAKSSPSSSPSSKSSSPASSPLKSLPSGPRSRKEVMKLRESEMMANTKFMAKALQSYKSSDKKHLSFPRGASVRVLVVNEEEGMFYGCCNKKVGWFPSYYVKTE